MPQENTPAKEHYDRFLSEHYLWMAGGFRENAARNRRFFFDRGIAPRATRIAVDLGAGCGFASIPLAEAGFSVTAVDFCRPLLDELRGHAPATGIDTITGDILDFPLWAGKRPELITCLGDTLTHLPDCDSVRDLIRHGYTELVPGGTLVLSLRDYSEGETGTVAIIPVRRDADRIFLCRLEYGAGNVSVTDILFSRRSGSWERSAGTYTKLRLAPGQIGEMLEQAGFRIDLLSADSGMVFFVGVKPD